MSFGLSLNDDLGQVSNTARKRSLPRFKFEENTSSSDDLMSADKAVDSNKAIALTYYVRRLLTRSLQAMFSHSEEIKAKRFVVKSAREKKEDMLLRTAMNRLKMFFK